MPKYIKFALTPKYGGPKSRNTLGQKGAGGELVYRATGQYYKKDYIIEGHTVYSVNKRGQKGRKIGTVKTYDKLTKKEQDVINKARIGRSKRRRKMIDNLVDDGFNVEDIQAIAESRSALGFPLSKEQIELMNFNEVLYNAMQDGYINDDMANGYLNEFMDAKTPNERKRVWNKLKAYFKDVGYDGSERFNLSRM